MHGARMKYRIIRTYVKYTILMTVCMVRAYRPNRDRSGYVSLRIARVSVRHKVQVSRLCANIFRL